MFDFHVHSSVSYDSGSSAESMSKAAAAIGLKEICFTDHFDNHTDPSEPPYTFDMADYRKAYEELEIPGLGIRKGLEFGLTEWNTDEFRKWESKYPFDFIIGSVHEVAGKDPYWGGYWTGDLEADFRRYLEHILLCVQIHEGFDVLGHLTFVAKCAGNTSGKGLSFEKYRDVTDAIMQELVRKDMGMEINTSSFDKTGGFMPSMAHIRRFKELGGKIITVGSDAHDPGRVGQHIPLALERLKDIFGYVCTFQNRQPVFHKL